MSAVPHVQAIADHYGYGHYTRQINEIAAALDRGESSAWVSTHLRDLGVSSERASLMVDRLFQFTGTTDNGPTTPVFDREVAAAVIRAFVQRGSAHLVQAGIGQAGASDEQVTALLQIAGLEDVPAPVLERDQVDPEAEHQGLLSRLASWARTRGFTG